MNKLFLFGCAFFFTLTLSAQKGIQGNFMRSDDTAMVDNDSLRIQEYEEIMIPSNYALQYRIALRRLKRVYPLALEAADIIDSLDVQLGTLNKTRKQKKLIRQTKNALKDNFKYVIKDLYISEGQLLSKLIYRETGMTVNEIMKKYKGGLTAGFYDMVGGMFEQDFNAKYDEKGDDFVVECVIQDILAGTIPFDFGARTVSKTEYKKSQKEYREGKKEARKLTRKVQREKRKIEKKKTQEVKSQVSKIH